MKLGIAAHHTSHPEVRAWPAVECVESAGMLCHAILVSRREGDAWMVCSDLPRSTRFLVHSEFPHVDFTLHAFDPAILPEWAEMLRYFERNVS